MRMLEQNDTTVDTKLKKITCVFHFAACTRLVYTECVIKGKIYVNFITRAESNVLCSTYQV